MENVLLCQREVRNFTGSTGERSVDLRHAALQYPGLCPALNILVSCRLEGMDEVGPLRVGVGVLFEIEPQTVTKIIFAEKEVELLQHSGRFLIDDRAIGGLRVLEVGDVLEDRRRALGFVDAVGQRLDLFVEMLPWVLLPAPTR